MHTRDELFQQYRKSVANLTRKRRDLEKENNEIVKLNEKKDNVQERVRKESEEQLNELKEKNCELQKKYARLNEQVKNVNLGIFNEGELRKNLSRQVESEKSKLLEDIDGKIEGEKNKLEILNRSYNQQLEIQRNFLENDDKTMHVFQHLIEKMHKDELPQNLKDALNNDSIDTVIQRNDLKNGQDVATISTKAKMLGNLEEYTRKWDLKVEIFYYFVVIFIGFLLLFGTGINMTFMASATSGILGVLHKLLIGLLGAVIGGVLGLIVGFAVGYTKPISIIGTIVGFLIAFCKTSYMPVYFSDQTVNGFEIVTKIIVLIILVIIAAVLKNKLELQKKIEGVLVKIPVFRKRALIQQNKEIEENLDAYYVLIKHFDITAELVKRMIDTNCKAMRESIDHALEERKSKIEKFDKEKFAWVESNVNEKREKYEKDKQHADAETKALLSQIENIKEQSQICEKEIVNVENGVDKKIEEELASCNKELEDASKRVEQKKNTIDGNVKEIKQLVDEIMSDEVCFPQLDKTHGEVSGSIYWKQEKPNEEFADIQEIQHNQNPVVFLYDTEERGQMRLEKVYPFVKELCDSFYYNNSVELIETSVIDKYNGGIPLKQYEDLLHIYDGKNITQFYQKLDHLVNRIATSPKGKDWNEVSRNTYETAGDIESIKFQMAVIIVAPLELDNKKYDDVLIDYSRKGKGISRGFLPFYVVDYRDWNKEIPENQSYNQTTIDALKKIVEANYIYRIDLDKKAIVK